MTEHYFTAEPVSESSPRTFQAELLGETLTFVTDAGVFSKTRVDAGTRLLVTAAEIPDGARVLDLGCGWGPVGVAIGRRHPDARVTLVDINQRAVELARRNLRQNQVQNGEVLAGDGFTAVPGRVFDVILFNPPVRAGKAVIYRLVDEAPDHLAAGGRLLVVIQRKQGADSFRDHMREVFGNAADIEKGGGYRVIASVR